MVLTMASQLLADIASLVPKEVIDGLDATYGFWRTLDFTYLFIGHCLFCAMAVPQLRDRFMVHYIVRAYHAVSDAEES